MQTNNPIFPTTPLRDAGEALKLLREGNARFVAGQPCAKDINEPEREVLAEGQSPFAIVLCCSDSRVAPETIFDQRLGNLFVLRNAGNVVDETVLGSIEYGAEHLGAPLIVVVGHSSCGAVTAVCSQAELPPKVEGIAARIRPSVSEGLSIDQVAHCHVRKMAAQIADDPLLRELGTTVVAAFFDIARGTVEFLD